MPECPRTAEIAIVGGGVVGVSIAYHLARAGISNVVLLERHQLTAGATWHAASIVARFRASRRLTRLLTLSADLYGRLEDETGLATGWRSDGSLRLATSAARDAENCRAALLGQSYGLDMSMIAPDDLAALFPTMCFDGVVSGLLCRDDATVGASDVTMALARAARQAGVRIIEGVDVTELSVTGDRVVGVETSGGTITCGMVVCAAGVWNRALLRRHGVHAPFWASHHQYIVTEPIEGMDRHLPFVRDPDNYTYFKEEVGSLVIGAYEPDPQPWPDEAVPEHFSFHLSDENWHQIEGFMERWTARIPQLESTGLKTVVNGLETFTPDGAPVVSDVPGLQGLFVAGGFNANGISYAGGVGATLADWVVSGCQPAELAELDIRRFGLHFQDRDQVFAQTLRGQATHYGPPQGAHADPSFGAVHDSPLTPLLERAGGQFRNWNGWRVADCVMPHPDRPELNDAHAQRSVLIDRSAGGQFRVRGPSLDDVCARAVLGDLDEAVGSIGHVFAAPGGRSLVSHALAVRLSEEDLLILCDPEQEIAWQELLNSVSDQAGGPASVEISSERGRAHLVLFVPPSVGAGDAVDELLTSCLADGLWCKRTAGGFAVVDILIDEPNAEPVVGMLLDHGSEIGLTLGGRRDYDRLALQAGLLSDGEVLAMDPGLLAPRLLFPGRLPSGAVDYDQETTPSAVSRVVLEPCEQGAVLSAGDLVAQDDRVVAYLAVTTADAAVAYLPSDVADTDSALIVRSRSGDVSCARKSIESDPLATQILAALTHKTASSEAP
ncbi:MAG: FAD-dependent oxidoreductase [Pseudomonadota bacterium]